MNKSTCDCCLSNNIELIGRHADFNHYLCKDCRFEFFVQEGTTTSSNLYENDSDYDDDLSVSGNYRDLLQWQHLIALRYLNTRKQGSPLILDVGCFNGFFVKQLCDMGYDAYGIDFNKKAIEFGAHRYGLRNRITVKHVDELVQENRSYDVISLFDVVEHVENPRELLLSLQGLLRDKGILILSTPNNHMLRRPALDYPPHHLCRFNPETVCQLLSSVGFNTVKQFEQMSTYNLIRHFVGSLYRNKNAASLRGGQLRQGWMVKGMRTTLNRLTQPGHVLFYPLDRLLYACGLRYIAQIVICRKD